MAALPAFFGPILAGLAGAMATHGLARLAARSRAPVRHGWRRVRPGAMHWTGIALAGGLVALMGYIGLFVGSSRTDAAFQMQVLWGLVAAFAACGSICLWQVRAICRADIAWRGRRLAFVGRDGVRVERAMDQIAEVQVSLWRAIALRFDDGAVLRLDPYATGAEELLGRIAERPGE